MRRTHVLFAVVAVGLMSVSAQARPEGPALFCQSYPDSPMCAGHTPSCAVCHTAPPEWNDYGYDVLYGLDDTFENALPDALAAIESEDSDGDGVSNLEEIYLGTLPGVSESVYAEPVLVDGNENPQYELNAYDVRFAYRRALISFCGRSPTFDELEVFDATVDKAGALHDAVDACLDSNYWRKEALHRIADPNIRPLAAIGTGDAAVVPLADFEWDYRLFEYIMTDGRDVRDLVTADYHVNESGQVVTGAIIDGNFGQPLLPQYRAGMITTQWFLMVHTMFSELPRTTAAQAYRAYLGQDIAKSEGIRPVAGEPLDVDNKGVTEPMCVRCHSTLDPLSYAFAYYEGIKQEDTGTFDPNRPGWSTDAISSSLLGQDLVGIEQNGVVPWGQAAAASDDFKRTVALMIVRHVLGDVTPFEEQDLMTLWQGLPDDNYSVEAMIHRFVDTDSFGVP